LRSRSPRIALASVVHASVEHGVELVVLLVREFVAILSYLLMCKKKIKRVLMRKSIEENPGFYTKAGKPWRIK